MKAASRQLQEAHERALAGKDHLLQVVDDFPFQSLLDKSAWMAGLLTVIDRAVCMPAPFFLVCGPAGSGKGLLCDLVARLATGQRAQRLRQSTGNADQRLQVIHTARRGAPLVVLDSLTRPLGNEKLDQALTATEWRVRLQGASTVSTLPLRTVWWGTSQAPRFESKRDTERRTIIIQLGQAVQDFSTRKSLSLITPSEYVTAHRDQLEEDARAILDGWAMVRGAGASADLPPLGEYETWSQTVRGALAWVGLPDPIGARLVNRERHSVPAELLEQGSHRPGLG